MTPAFDIARARGETPGCSEVLHFNNAGAALQPLPVSRIMHDYLHQEERIGGYETAEREHRALDHFYQQAARLLHCQSDEIAFVENATRAWDMVFYAIALKPGDRILTTVSEYGSNVIAYNHRVRHSGAELVVVPDDEHGRIDTAALAAMIDERVRLISISHIPTGGGLVQPAAEVGRIARAAGVPYLLDGCQAVGQMPIDVQAIGCDALSGTGRKYLRGPRGTGFLYVRRDLIERLDPPFLDSHSARLTTLDTCDPLPDARRFENWEQNFAGKAALGAAMEYALGWGLDAIQQRVWKLAAALREKLAEMDGVTIIDRGLEKCGIVTFTTAAANCDAIKQALSQQAINVSVTNAWGTPFCYGQRNLDNALRASVHYYNCDEEIARFTAALRRLLF